MLICCPTSLWLRTERRVNIYSKKEIEEESLYFVGSGIVVVVLKIPRQAERILRKYKAGAILGEMAIYTGANRTASVRIESDACLYRLDKEKLEEMSRRFPASTAALNTYIVKVLSERLGTSEQELESLYLASLTLPVAVQPEPSRCPETSLHLCAVTPLLSRRTSRCQ